MSTTPHLLFCSFHNVSDHSSGSLLVTCPYYLSFASFTFSVLSANPHLLSFSLHNIFFLFISSFTCPCYLSFASLTLFAMSTTPRLRSLHSITSLTNSSSPTCAFLLLCNIVDKLFHLTTTAYHVNIVNMLSTIAPHFVFNQFRLSNVNLM